MYHSHPEKVNIALTSAGSEFRFNVIDRDASVDHKDEQMILEIGDLADDRLAVTLGSGDNDLNSLLTDLLRDLVCTLVEKVVGLRTLYRI